MKRESKRKEYLWAVITAISCSAILTFFTCDSCHEDTRKFFNYVLFSSVIWVLIWMGNSEMNDFLSRKISWIEKPYTRFATGLVATVLFTVAAAMLIVKGFEFALGFRFSSYTEILVSSLIITFFISLFFHGRGFLLEWRRSAVAAERYQKESMRANFENLKNQVNPHFLFNNLNVLTSLVYEDQHKAAKFIKQLSDVYRYVLDTRDQEVVPLEEELKFMDSYLFLQQIRFGDKLKIKNNLNGVKGNLPPLSLQMLVENAIKHNIVSEEQPLHIHLYYDDEKLVVENSLQRKKTTTEDSPGVGLQNIKKRYEFLSQREVEITKNENIFRVKLPILYEKE